MASTPHNLIFGVILSLAAAAAPLSPFQPHWNRRIACRYKHAYAHNLPPPYIPLLTQRICAHVMQLTPIIAPCMGKLPPPTRIHTAVMPCKQPVYCRAMYCWPMYCRAMYCWPINCRAHVLLAGPMYCWAHVLLAHAGIAVSAHGCAHHICAHAPLSHRLTPPCAPCTASKV